MPTLTVPDFNQMIFNFFEEKIQAQGVASHFVQRKSKLTPLAFFKAIMGSCFSANKITLESVCHRLKEQDIELSRQALHQRMNERTVAFCETLFSHALQNFTINLDSPSHLQDLFSSVYLIDSSTLSLPNSLYEYYKGCGGNAAKAAVKLQVLYDHLDGQIKELTLTPGHKNDQSFDFYFSTIKSQALYLIDLGYFKLDSLKKIMTGEAYFITRYFSGTKLFTVNNQPIDLIDILPKSGSYCYQQNVLIGAEAKLNVRLIAEHLPDDVVAQRIRKLRRAYKRRGIKPSATKLSLCRWNIFITNISDISLDAKQVMSTYALRWQIELLFKLSKSWGFKLNEHRSNNPARVRIELYIKLICLILLLLFCSLAQQKSNKMVSFFKAYNYLFYRARDFINSLSSLFKLKRFTRAFLDNLVLFAIKEIKNKNKCVKNPSLEKDF